MLIKFSKYTIYSFDSGFDQGCIPKDVLYVTKFQVLLNKETRNVRYIKFWIKSYIQIG